MLILLFSAATLVALPSSSSWISEDDYPQEAIDVGAEGLVEVDLSVGPDGAPTGCTFVKTAANEALNSSTCRLLVQRARFVHLQNGEKTTQPSKYRQAVFWKIPAADPISAITSGSVAKTSILEGGTLGDCLAQKFGDQRFDAGDLCEISRNAKMLEYFAKDSLINLTTVYFRMYVEPKPKNYIEVRGQKGLLKRYTVIQASFSVSKLGFIQNCRVDKINQLFKEMNICAGVSKTTPEFQPDPTRSAPTPMTVIVDIWSEKRAL